MIVNSTDGLSHIKTDHKDGPLLVIHPGGRCHWLTWRERIAFWWGHTTVDDLVRKYQNATTQQLLEGTR